MSLGIAIKGPEGIVLAADSRVTLFTQFPNTPVPGQLTVIPANFDNATKILSLNTPCTQYVGAVTYGLGAMMTPAGPRTMHSFIPEFEADLVASCGTQRVSVQDFADRLSGFFLTRWNDLVGRSANPGEEIFFLVGGYDEGAPYGRVFLFQVPTQPSPKEQNARPGEFGITWGGQHELVNRLLSGYDAELPSILAARLQPQEFAAVMQELQARFAAAIPYQFLPLQDCVDLAAFLIRSTITFQRFRTTVRGVGGPVEVATITRATPFTFVVQKKLSSAT